MSKIKLALIALGIEAALILGVVLIIMIMESGIAGIIGVVSAFLLFFFYVIYKSLVNSYIIQEREEYDQQNNRENTTE